MSEDLQKALENLREILQRECNKRTVSVCIFVNSQGCEISYTLRSPESLKRDGISMRNIKGDFIK